MARHYREPTPPKASSEDLELRWRRTVTTQIITNLPGFGNVMETDEKICKWIENQEARIRAAIRDRDEILFEQALGAWLKAAARVNEILAEEYRQAIPDPLYWNLRYVKWMIKVSYILFTSPRGEFYLYPRRPSRRPPTPYWYTADEMIDMLHPTIAATMQLSDKLPPRPETLRGPAANEKHLHIHVDEGQVSMKFDCGEVPHAGEGVR